MCSEHRLIIMSSAGRGLGSQCYVVAEIRSNKQVLATMAGIGIREMMTVLVS